MSVSFYISFKNIWIFRAHARYLYAHFTLKLEFIATLEKYIESKVLIRDFPIYVRFHTIVIYLHYLCKITLRVTGQKIPVTSSVILHRFFYSVGKKVIRYNKLTFLIKLF